MKQLKYILLLFICTAVTQFSFAQDKPTITKVTKFKPPVVTSFLGVNKNGATVTVDEAAQLIALPLKITDEKGNFYPIDSYQFLYRKKGGIQDEQTGKVTVTFTVESDRFTSTPLPKIWIDNLNNGFQKDEQLYFFDIVVKDKEGRRFFAPELKIMIQ
ncbi:MAG TPA: hypothetical protein VN726_05755 [Hanamia sp.]|nr:hypothetical protein [Hanamia sp.]